MLSVINWQWFSMVESNTTLALPSSADTAHSMCRLLPSISRPLPMFWAFLSTRWCAMSNALEEALEARSLAVCFTMLQLLWLPTYYAALCDSSWTETRTCTSPATGTPFWAPTRSAHTAFSLCILVECLLGCCSVCSGLLTPCRASCNPHNLFTSSNTMMISGPESASKRWKWIVQTACCCSIMHSNAQFHSKISFCLCWLQQLFFLFLPSSNHFHCLVHGS